MEHIDKRICRTSRQNTFPNARRCDWQRLSYASNVKKSQSFGEHFQRVNHQLMAVKGATLAGLKTVRSHVQALSQCRNTLRQMGLTPVTRPDTDPAAVPHVHCLDR